MAVTVDAAYLASPSGGDEWSSTTGLLLKRAGEVYTLAVNITSERTGIIIGAAGITLDLNGKVVTYNNGAAITVTNGGFESDSLGSSTPSGWVLTEAADSTFEVVDPTPHYLFGSRALKWTIPVDPTGTIAVGNPATVTVTGHGFSTGDKVILYGFTTTPSVSAVNGVPHTITVTGANTFTIPVNVTAVTVGTGRVNLQQVLRTPTVSIPAANRTYMATMVAADWTGTTKARAVACRMIPYDATTNTALANYAWSNANSSQAGPKVSFTPTTTNSVYFKIHATPSSSSVTQAAVVYLDNLKVTRCYDYGVLCSDASASSTSFTSFTQSGTVGTTPNGTKNLSAAALAVVGNGNGNPVIKCSLGTGRIVQGTAAGNGCVGVACFDQIGTPIIDGVNVEINGDDTFGISAYSALTTAPLGAVRTVRNCSVEYDANAYVIDRASNMAAIFCMGGSSTHVHDNTLTGYPQMGVRCGSFIAGQTCVIEDNTLVPAGQVTNAYSLYGAGVEISFLNNTVTGNTTGTGGRGLLVAANANQVVNNVLVEGNVIDLHELGNREYGTYGAGISCRALRLRNIDTEGAIKNITVRNNTFIARCKTGYMRVAHAARLSLNAYTTNKAGPILIENNTFRAIIEGASDPGSGANGYWAAAVSIDASGPFPVSLGINDTTDINLVFRGNTFETSEYGVVYGGTDGGGGRHSSDIELYDSTFTKLATGFTGRTFVSHSISHANGPAIQNGSFNETYTGNIARNLRWGTATVQKSYDFGNTLTVHVTGTAGANVEDATVQLKDNTTAVVATDLTDAAGNAAIDAVTDHYEGTTSITHTDKRPHELVVSATGYTTRTVPILNLSAPLTINLDMTTGGTTPVGSMHFSAADYPFTTTGNATIRVDRLGVTSGTASINYATTGTGTAVAGTDFTATSGTLNFANGDTFKTFNVNILAVPGSGFKTVGLQISNPVTATLGEPDTATITIAPPAPEVAPSGFLTLKITGGSLTGFLYGKIVPDTEG